jgi:formate hydrogenlyase subunit 3/multisubunit Na+/H+ antiporter MnhD subunit
MNGLLTIVTLPLITGLLLFLIPEKLRTVKGIVALIISIITLSLTIFTYRIDLQTAGLESLVSKSGILSSASGFLHSAGRYIIFNNDNLSMLIILFISLFAFLVVIYSLAYIREGDVLNYYPWFLITLGCSYGAVLSDNLLLFLFFWGILGISLYKLIHGHNEASSAAAKKTLILIGASDSIMVVGIAIVWKITGSLSMSHISIQCTDVLSATAFLSLLIGSFTKAGAFPFHTWVPDYAENAPASSSAYLPASLDKLLGIYFLARITTRIFVLNDWITFLLLLTGVVTIIAAVLMALVQHDYKRLLGYHAVSQVGYMIVGFGLGSMIGIAAGLFHLINNAIYKSGLFMAAGCVEYRTGKNNLEDLGGLSKAMPVTFFVSLIFAMSISGVPPFNGFASKWMIYQGIIDFGNGGGVANKLWIVWLGLAVLGSALTLASFIKFIGGIFLSRRKPEFDKVREAPALMWMPLLVLALLCIVLGVFSTNLVVQKLFMPVTGIFSFTGTWNSMFVSLLVIISIIFGLIVYLATNIKKFRHDDSFIGGEKIQEQTAYPTPEFYKTLTEFRLFSFFFRKAEEKRFDIYDISKKFVLWLSHVFSDAHTGVLPGYILWVFAGLIIMLLIMI